MNTYLRARAFLFTFIFYSNLICREMGRIGVRQFGYSAIKNHLHDHARSMRTILSAREAHKFASLMATVVHNMAKFRT